MKLRFVELSEEHFPLLLTWLEKPHVKVWWDTGVQWTLGRIVDKYMTYTKGYKIEEGKRIKIDAYILYDHDIPFGYIQAYFPIQVPKKSNFDLTGRVAGIDLYIGDEKYLGQGFSLVVLNDFLNQKLVGYDYAIVDPDEKNNIAIKIFLKSGFQMIDKEPYIGNRWMFKKLSKAKNG